MAIWQVHLYLINPNGKIHLSSNTFIDSLKKFEKEFPEEKSWCESIKQYGSLDSTCMEIYFDENSADEISLRIDVRSITEYQLQVIIKFNESNGFIIRHDDMFYDSSINNLVAIIKGSKAVRFIMNPQGFLEKLSESS